jgi:hypothetical protein
MAVDWRRCHLQMPCWSLDLCGVKSWQAWIKVGSSKSFQTTTIGLSKLFLPIVGSKDIIEFAICISLTFAVAS